MSIKISYCGKQLFATLSIKSIATNDSFLQNIVFSIFFTANVILALVMIEINFLYRDHEDKLTHGLFSPDLLTKSVPWPEPKDFISLNLLLKRILDLMRHKSKLLLLFFVT